MTTLTPANLTLTDLAGNTASYEVAVDGLQPSAVSAVKQYWFLKTHADSSLTPVLFWGDWFYRGLLLALTLALSLTVLIKIKQQHPQTIMASLGLIGFLILLIIF